MATRFVVENCVLATLSAATVLGLYYMGAGGWSAVGFGYCLWMNFSRK